MLAIYMYPKAYFWFSKLIISILLFCFFHSEGLATTQKTCPFFFLSLLTEILIQCQGLVQTPLHTFLAYANGRDVPVLKFHGSFVHTTHINPLYCLVCGHFGMFLTFVLCCQPLGRVAAVIFALHSLWRKKKTTLRDRSLENIWLWEWM